MPALTSYLMVSVIFLVLICLIQIVRHNHKINKLKELHEVELRVKHANGYTLGWNDAVEKIDEVVEAYFERPKNMVHHCNRKTDYEMIIHPFDPDNCENCKEIKGILQEDSRLTLES